MTKRVKTPTILQMEASECGAAALAIVLAYFGRYVALEEMRVQCGVSRDGSKAVNVLKAARNYGLTANAAKIEEIEAFAEASLPCIVFWEFDHFVVVEGFKKDKVYINDPATGPRVVDRKQFSKSFTGVALLLEPGEDFEKGGTPPRWFPALRSRLHGSMKSILFVILASFCLVVTGVLAASFGKVFVDDILIRGNANWLLPLLVGMLATAIIRGVLTWLEEYYLLRLQVKLMLTSSAKFFSHVLCLPLTFFQQRYAGDISERIGANTRIAELLSDGVSANVINLFSMVFFAVAMFLLSWQLALISVVVAIMNASLLYYMARGIADKTRKLLQDDGKLSGIEMNGLYIIETLKAAGLRSDFFTRWAGIHAKTINGQQQIMTYTNTLGIVSDILSGLLTVVTIGLGSWLIMQGQITAGTLVAFQSIAASFQQPIMELLGLAEQIQEIKGDLARLDDVLQHKRDPQLTEKKTDQSLVVIKPAASLEFKGVSFGYSVLEDPLYARFDWLVKAGSHVAIVGVTGSGKSTLAKLASGLYQPWTGQVLLDGQPIITLPQNVLALSTAAVDQEISLFSGTVRDNLTMWDHNIVEQSLYQALQDACLLEEVMQRGGLAAEISENGLNFSGGQRQRLEIARALVQNPGLLILDEATASLDPIVEKRIYDNLKQRHCTLLVIAHRLSTIRDSDQIIVLDEGIIAQCGTHDTLVRQPGLYRSLVTGDIGDE